MGLPFSAASSPLSRPNVNEAAQGLTGRIGCKSLPTHWSCGTLTSCVDRDDLGEEGMLRTKRRRGWTIVFLCLGWCALGAMAAAAARPSQVRHQRYSAADRERRLAEADLRAGDPALIRIFKQNPSLRFGCKGVGASPSLRAIRSASGPAILGQRCGRAISRRPKASYRIGVDQLRPKGRNARSFYQTTPTRLSARLAAPAQPSWCMAAVRRLAALR